VKGNKYSTFHVLTFSKAGGIGTQTPATPAVPAAGSDVALVYSATSTNTNSSPLVIYTPNPLQPNPDPNLWDVVYVGTDDGWLYKITGVFNGNPAIAGAPWPIKVSTAMLTSPGIALNVAPESVVVGDANGVLFAVDASAGKVVASHQIGAGAGVFGGGLVDGPIVDEINSLVFVFTANSSNNVGAVVVETDANLNELARVSVGLGSKGATSAANAVNLHAGAFDNNYINFSPNVGLPAGSLYVCGTASNSTIPALYQVPFNGAATPVLTVPGAPLALATTPATECSPISEIPVTNPTTSATYDNVLLSVTQGCAVSGIGPSGCILDFNVTNGLPAAPASVTAEAGGTSGITVDNGFSSLSVALLRVYFSTLGTSTSCGGQTCLVVLSQ
jgi:hypothetical protein